MMLSLRMSLLMRLISYRCRFRAKISDLVKNLEPLPAMPPKLNMMYNSSGTPSMFLLIVGYIKCRPLINHIYIKHYILKKNQAKRQARRSKNSQVFGGEQYCLIKLTVSSKTRSFSGIADPIEDVPVTNLRMS